MPVHRTVATRPYRIEVAGITGPFDLKYFRHFKSMLEQAIKWKELYPKAVLTPSNADRADYNFDGLTDEEREEFWEVLSEDA